MKAEAMTLRQALERIKELEGDFRDAESHIKWLTNLHELTSSSLGDRGATISGLEHLIAEWARLSKEVEILTEQSAKAGHDDSVSGSQNMKPNGRG